MKKLRLLILALVVAGCASRPDLRPAATPPAPAAHPLADKIVARVFLKDGKMLLGRVNWEAATRTYLVEVTARNKPRVAADRVVRIQEVPSRIVALHPTNQIVCGKVEVFAKVGPVVEDAYPSILFADIGGPPRAELHRVGTTDQWKGRLDSTLVPNGTNTLNLIGWTADGRRIAGVAPVTVENSLKCFFADLHAHTGYSDGTSFPPDAFAFAREVSKLDVFALTDHLESMTDEEWSDAQERSYKANEDGAFVTIPGLEWTTKAGHSVILDPGTRRWPDDVAGFYKAAAKAGVIAKINHPADGTVVFGGLAYSEEGDRAVELMEVRSPIEELAYIRALNLGWHLGPDGSDDTHKPTWGGRFWTGIWAPGLTRRNVWAALKARHCFSSTDRNCRLLFTLNGATMGDIVADPVRTVNVEVLVDDPDPKDTTARVELFQDGVVVQAKEPNSARCDWKTSCSPAIGNHYYFVKVLQTDSNMLWSAPVWINKMAE